MGLGWGETFAGSGGFGRGAGDGFLVGQGPFVSAELELAGDLQDASVLPEVAGIGQGLGPDHDSEGAAEEVELDREEFLLFPGMTFGYV